MCNLTTLTASTLYKTHRGKYIFKKQFGLKISISFRQIFEKQQGIKDRSIKIKCWAKLRQTHKNEFPLTTVGELTSSHISCFKRIAYLFQYQAQNMI